MIALLSRSASGRTYGSAFALRAGGMEGQGTAIGDAVLVGDPDNQAFLTVEWHFRLRALAPAMRSKISFS